jgi:hypothetical protein
MVRGPPLAEESASTGAWPIRKRLAPGSRRIRKFIPAETPETQQPLTHVTFLENFGGELQRKVPAGK